MFFTSKVSKVAGVAAMLALAASSAVAQSTVLKFSTMEAPNGPTFKCFTEQVLNEMVEATGNTLEIEAYMGGTAFANPRKQYEQVARGVMDVSQGVLTYNPGQFSMTEVAGLPLLVSDPKDAARAINKLAPEYLGDEFKDIHLLAILVTPPLNLHLREPITSLDELNGLRIRTTGVGAAEFIEGFGGIPVRLPTPAIYENMQTGVIDGALSSLTSLRSFKIGEVAPYHILINTSSALLFLGMNKNKLASLPQETQDIIKSDFSGADVGVRATACWQQLGGQYFGELLEEGHTEIKISDADYAKAEEIATQVGADYIAKLEAEGKPAQAFYDALVAEMNALAKSN